MLDETIIRLSELNNSLPRFCEEIDLIANHSGLQWPLQDLYADYIDFCVAVTRYLNKKPFGKPRVCSNGNPYSYILGSEFLRSFLALNSSSEFTFDQDSHRETSSKLSS